MPVVEVFMSSTVATLDEQQEQIRDFPTMEIILCIVCLCFTILILILLGLNEFIQFRRFRNADYQVNPEVIDLPKHAAAPVVPQSKDEHF